MISSLPPDPKRIVDDVLASVPASVFDATPADNDRLVLAQAELKAIADELVAFAGRLRSLPLGIRAKGQRAFAAREKRLEAAVARLDGYWQPYFDRQEGW